MAIYTHIAAAKQAEGAAMWKEAAQHWRDVAVAVRTHNGTTDSAPTYELRAQECEVRGGLREGADSEINIINRLTKQGLYDNVVNIGEGNHIGEKNPKDNLNMNRKANGGSVSAEDETMVDGGTPPGPPSAEAPAVHVIVTPTTTALEDRLFKTAQVTRPDAKYPLTKGHVKVTDEMIMLCIPRQLPTSAIHVREKQQNNVYVGVEFDPIRVEFLGTDGKKVSLTSNPPSVQMSFRVG